MKHAFITGAAGFIGGYAVREFVEQGWHVTALVHKRTSPFDAWAAEGRVTILHGDLDDPGAIESTLAETDLDAIIHCAGRASDVGRRDEFRRANYESVRSLCGMVERLNVPRLVYVSTTDVYGLRDFHRETEDELPLDMNIRNPYPEFKIASEEWIRKTLPKERYAIIRPAAVWGVGDPTLTPRIVSFIKSSPWIIHFGKWHGKNRWPLAHVRNVAAALYLAATMPEAAGLAVNVLDTEVTTIDDLYRIIASIYMPEKHLKSVTLPIWLGIAFGAFVSAVSNALNLDHPFTDPSLYALHSIASNLDFSNTRLLNLLEIGGRRIVTREEGIEELREQTTG